LFWGFRLPPSRKRAAGFSRQKVARSVFCEVMAWRMAWSLWGLVGPGFDGF